MKHTNFTETTSKEITAYAFSNKIFAIDGCNKECAVKTHHLSLCDVWSTHQRFHILGRTQQRQWVLDYLFTNTSNETRFVIAGKDVCLAVWLEVLGLSRTRYYEVRKAYADGVVSFQRFSNTSVLRPKSCKAIAWMQHYFHQVGDQMPDRMAIHLPSFLTNALVYSRMIDELEIRGDEVISKSQFYNLWTLHFPHVTIPKVKCNL